LIRSESFLGTFFANSVFIHRNSLVACLTYFADFPYWKDHVSDASFSLTRFRVFFQCLFVPPFSFLIFPFPVDANFTSLPNQFIKKEWESSYLTVSLFLPS